MKQHKASNHERIDFIIRVSIWFSTFALILWGRLVLGVQFEWSGQTVQEVNLRAKAAHIVIQKSAGSMVRLNIQGAKENLWNQEIQGTTLTIVGPEDGLTVNDVKVVVEIPQGIMQSYFSFEDVNAEILGASRVTLQALRGKVAAKSTGEATRIFLQKGEISGQDFNGSLEIECFNGKVQILNGQSSLKLRQFSGDFNIVKNSGTIKLEAQNVQGKILGQQGLVSMNWGKGSLQLLDFSGRAEGTSMDGLLTFGLKPESLIDLQAVRGKVSVELPRESGASLNIRSVSGELNGPSSIRPAREGRFKVIRGKMAGSLKGSVVVSSEEASVTVR